MVVTAGALRGYPPSMRKCEGVDAACPCGSGLAADACCARFHRGEAEAETPEALMRSRYAAFALGAYEYVWATLHPDHDDRAGDRDAYLAQLRRGASQRKYRELEVLDTRDPDGDGVALVLFAASITDRGKDASFVELSRFVHDGRGWRYLFGTTKPRGAFPKRLDGVDVAAFERA